VTRALEIEPTLGEAHASLAYILWQCEFDMAGAEREFLRAIELAPNYPPAHYWYSAVLGSRGLHEQATAEVEKALALDPMSYFTNVQMGWLALRQDNIDRAVAYLPKAIELNPGLAIGHLLLGEALLLKARYSEAIAELQEAERLSGGDAWTEGVLVYAYAASGRKDEALRLLDRMLAPPAPGGFRRSIALAFAFTGLGDKDRAFEFLNMAYEERDPLLSLAKLEPLFDPLHGDPRWAPLIEKLYGPEAR
jgi:tetratricopeptide (TPR) repeat protein